MTDADIQLAREADRLRTDPPFENAIKAMRKDAIEALVSVDPTDTAAVMNLQAYVKAIDGLCTEIAAQILRGTTRKETPVA